MCHERNSMKQSGMSLIEVMVAIFILGTGLLGLGGLQARSVMMNQSAYYRSIAADLASDLADRIRANRSPFWSRTITTSDGVVTGNGISSGLPLPPNFGTCTGDGGDMKCPQSGGRNSYRVAPIGTGSADLGDMAEWKSNVASQLPNGTYKLTTDAATCLDTPTTTAEVLCRYTLTLTWKDDRSASGGADFSYVTVIE